MIEIDGSIGEGGGQVLRSSLALSLLTGQDLHIYNIRARRSNPGLQPQHIMSVQGAAQVGHADTEGASLKSTTLIFRPKGVFPGRFRFDIGTAGAASLVLQTIFLPLSRASVTSSVTITGGTHVPMSPSFHYLDLHWLPFMRRLGFSADLSLIEAGFYPRGGGKIQATIRPTMEVTPLQLTERGNLRQIRGISAVANLDRKIAERQRSQVLHRLGARYPLNDLRIHQMASRFKGTLLLLLAEFDYSQACYFSLGALGKPAERVADEAVDALLDFLDSDGAVDQYLADQLLLPLSLSHEPSRFTTSRITNHLLTNAKVIQSFVPVTIVMQQEMDEPASVLIQPLIKDRTEIPIHD
jgi:RNA 3'-terminal phosphate cyclase (ATP)